MRSEKIPEHFEDAQEWTLPPFGPKQRLLLPAVIFRF